jgi:hypothetical protein
MSLRGELVADGQRADELLLGQQRCGELVAEGVGIDGREDRVELVPADLREQLLPGALDEVDRHAGMLGVEDGDDRVEVVEAGRPHAAEAQVAPQQAGHLVELVAQAFDLAAHAPRVVEDERALNRQLDAAARPREERGGYPEVEVTFVGTAITRRDASIATGAGGWAFDVRRSMAFSGEVNIGETMPARARQRGQFVKAK